jgi:glutamine cyclotransferase
VAVGALVAVALVVLSSAYWYGRTRSLSQPAEPTVPGAAVSGHDRADPIAQRAPSAERLRADVLSERHHDPSAFTQGLVLDGGWLYESTGMYGESTLREVDPQTGEVKRQVDLAPELFGEGLALVGDRLLQLTWRAQIALEYEQSTFDQTSQHTYSGEGWGLCFDGERLVMSDGSSDLTFRDANTFDVLGTLPVTLDGQPVQRLNELECVDGSVYANVWQTDTIVEIDATTGRVRATIDASGLLPPGERDQADVLNGIAYDPETDTFLVTGKWWPKLFEVRFVPDRQAFLPGVVTGF